jgi:CubicO group peptidase (beta-lactamase class C family)
MQTTQEDPFLTNAGTDESGMNIRRLDSMKEVFAVWKIRDVVIVRHGRPVWDWHDGGKDRIGPIYSCTKSILSALIGIAVGEGLIKGASQPVSDFIKPHDQADARLKDMPLAHFLTMTPGLDWPDFDKPYNEMKQSPDWMNYVLETPIVHEPGEVFTYNSGGSHLLSAVLTKATGLSAAEYANKRLFGKLGFRKTKWPSSGGVNEGGAGLMMSSRDLAKFGLLYLQKGKWNGERIIPEQWVDSSTSTHHKGLVNYEPPIYGCYGYHWWVSPAEHNGIVDYYFALGFGGQYLFVVPELDLAVVVRKSLAGKNNAILSKRLLFDYILPSVL